MDQNCLTPQCATHCRVEHRGVYPTMESSSAVCITSRSQGHQISQENSAVCIPPRSQTPRCASHRRVKLHGVHHTEESKCKLRSQNQNLYESLGAFKGTIRRNPFRGQQFYHVRKDLKKKNFVAKTKTLTPRCDAHHRVEFFELCDQISRRNHNRIRKYFSLFIMKKMGDLEISWHTPFKFVVTNHCEIALKPWNYTYKQFRLLKKLI